MTPMIRTLKSVHFNDDGDSEYTISVEQHKNKTIYNLFASADSKVWTESVKGTLLMQMIDDGNGLKFNHKLSRINYAQAYYIKVLPALNLSDAGDTDEMYCAEDGNPNLIIL